MLSASSCQGTEGWAMMIGMSGKSTATSSSGMGFQDRKSTRLNSSHSQISYAVFCLKKKKNCSYTQSSMYSTLSYYPPNRRTVDSIFHNHVCLHAIIITKLSEFRFVVSTYC